MIIKCTVYKVEDLLKHKNVLKYIKQLNNLIKISFNNDMTDETYKKYLEYHKYILIAFYKSKIIGSLYILEDELYKNNDINLQTYVLKERDPSIWTKKVKLFPMITTFCRTSNDKYKGIGKIMLHKISKFLKEYKKIYCVPESIIGQYDKCTSYDNKNNKYYTENMKLIEYYKKMKFKIFKNHYVLDFCENNKYIILNVMYKKI